MSSKSSKKTSRSSGKDSSDLKSEKSQKHETAVVENKPTHVDPVDKHEVKPESTETKPETSKAEKTKTPKLRKLAESDEKKLTVSKGNVTVVNASGRKVSKSVVEPKKTLKKAKKAATSVKKSKKSLLTKKVIKKSSSQKKNKSSKKYKTESGKLTKSKRPYNMKPSPFDFAGIGLGPAKVKKVLIKHAFNPVEYTVRSALLEAENRPVRPKPTPENPDPEMSKQGPQTPVDQIHPNYLSVIKQAEELHKQSLCEEYEKSVYAGYSADKKKAYQDLRKKFLQAENSSDLKSFNLQYDKNFYHGFDKFCEEKDSYLLTKMVANKSTGDKKERFNQWTRAMALVNKMCIRLSSGVRDVLACYLDNIVVQYAKNGIHNCLLENHSNLQLRHALNHSDGFDSRVPMDAFARTLDGYQLALNWISACQQTKDEIKDLRDKIKKGKIKGKTVEVEMPEYPDPKYDENFEGYVVEICRSVRMELAEKQNTTAGKTQYHNIKISENFKKFCSIIVYESILRIGSHLKEMVNFMGVKTVSKKLMYNTLRQVSNMCGFDYESIQKDMDERLSKFEEWCHNRRHARRNKKNEKDERKENQEKSEEKDTKSTSPNESDADEDSQAEENSEDDIEVEYDNE